MRPLSTRVGPLATAAMLLGPALLVGGPAAAEDSPEVARQKATRKAQEALIAAAKQGNVQPVRTLLEQGTDVNARDGSQRTPLVHAARGGRLAVVRVLVEARADLDARDADGRTALMEAARRAEAQPAVELVAAGADVNLADRHGWTALMGAAREGTLVAARAIVHAPGQASLDLLAREDSALSLAAGHGRTALVRTLIAAGVGVRKPEIGGRALKVAADEGYVEVVLALMEAHAPLGFTAWDGELPLHAAAARGQQKIVELLLEG
ncbi:MAG TPA: ankyrin repeat domain-containing protein, partial [Vicinamibacteria bacterium]|nr:ankyrin repeat domain-containing protein [Vicinamibacteria bacterium]